MIRMINGTIEAITDVDATLNIGPLSFSVLTPRPQQFHVGQEIGLHAYLHWNQEQGPSLFGFTSELERAVFLLIISCSGLGPKIGLAVLAAMEPEQFVHAIQTNNEKTLSSVSGIGAKKAEQMIAHLRHKVGKLAKIAPATTSSALSHWDDVTQALTSLNYTRTEIANTMRYLGETHGSAQLPFDQLMRHALSFLAKKT